MNSADDIPIGVGNPSGQKNPNATGEEYSDDLLEDFARAPKEVETNPFYDLNF